jgi:putative oxidoreductase
MGSPATLALVIFAEFFCAIFIILGLFTRLAAVPLIVAMGYAFFVSNSGNLFGDGESAALFLTVFLALLLCGPGRISVDGMIQK